MRIAICGSMALAEEMLRIGKKLTGNGHKVTLPQDTKKYANLNEQGLIEENSESARKKVHGDLIRNYFEEIKKNDAVLIVNQKRHGIEDYIGGNSLIEMSFAHILKKKIFILNPIPEISYIDEIKAMQPTVIENNLARIQ